MQYWASGIDSGRLGNQAKQALKLGAPSVQSANRSPAQKKHSQSLDLFLTREQPCYELTLVANLLPKTLIKQQPFVDGWIASVILVA